MTRVDGQDLPKASNRFVVVLLVPGDVAELAQTLDVIRTAFQHRQCLTFMRSRNAEGELDPIVVRVELEALPVLTRPVLQLAPPVGQVAARDVAGNTPMQG